MLTSEEQEIIFAHYWEGLTFDEIGKRGGVSRQRVHQIESKALNKLRRIPAVNSSDISLMKYKSHYRDKSLYHPPQLLQNGIHGGYDRP